MRMLDLVLCSVVTSLIVCSPNYGKTLSKKPRLICDNPHYDFGKVDSSKTIKHIFTMENKGDSPLKISRVRASCACVGKIVLSKKYVPPDSTTELRVQFSLRGRTRSIHQPILVQSNDPETPNLKLLVEGTAIESIRIVPSQIIFGTLTDDARVSKYLDVSAVEKASDFKIVKVASDVPNFVPTVAALKDGRKYRVHITTKPPLPHGAVKGTVQIFTNSKKCPIINVPFSSIIGGELLVLPENIVLFDKVNATRYVVVMPGKTKTFELLGAEPPLKSIIVNTFDMKEKGYRIRLSNLEPVDDLEGKVLRIRTNVKGMEQISVPFQVFRQKKTAGLTQTIGGK